MVETVAQVTGASEIGRATSRRLSIDEIAIGVLDISGDSAEKVAIDITAAGGKAIGLTFDAFSREQVSAAEISFEREELKPRFQAVVEAGPIRQHGEEDVASAAAWLISDEAGHVTGQVIRVNGGRYV